MRQDRQQPSRTSSDFGRLPSKEEIHRIITEGGRPLVETAERLGRQFQQGGLTTAQIRNVFGVVKQMQMSGFDPKKFILLKPKLAYAAARANKRGAEDFRNVISMAIDAVGESEENFQRFVDFFEAILAYHKAAGGK